MRGSKLNKKYRVHLNNINITELILIISVLKKMFSLSVHCDSTVVCALKTYFNTFPF